jgi:uncharacterized protein (TIGR02996 family)
MSDAPAFFRAIEAEPDDDTPRLVYADWHDEHATGPDDRARAEFVRLQCARARTSGHSRETVLTAREQQLLAAHGAAWAAPWPTKLHAPAYDRGFLDPIHLGPEFPRFAARLADLMPLHHLRLFKARVVMKALAACPQLALVRRLSMTNNVLRNAHVTALVPSPHLGRLTHLDLSKNQIGVCGATDLAAAAPTSLRVLRIASNPIRGRGLLALGLADWPALERLDVNHCELNRAGVIGFAQGALVRRLTALQVSNNALVPPDAWAVLARAPMGRLVRLDLSTTGVTDDVIEALAANPALACLRVVHLGGTVTDRGARALLSSPHLRNLQRLRVPSAHILPALRKELGTAFGTGFNPLG